MYQPYEIDFVPEPAVKPREAWRDHLLKAAQLIRERGHLKHDFTDGQRLCTFAAIAIASGMSIDVARSTTWGSDLPSHAMFAKGIGLPGVTYICSWNNAPQRTADEVSAALEGAARS